MGQKLWVALFTMMAAGVLPGAAAAEESGWKNPFASSAKAPASNAPTSGWKFPKMPSLLPQTASKPRKKSNQPSTWNRMTSGTRSFFNKTADVLTPWDNEKPAETPALTGSKTAFTRNNRAKSKSAEPKDSSILPASWWGGEKSSQPKTVNDFLSQPRPQ